MAQPFFKGNYGSALARVDTRPIIEAGRAQGAMYANLGNEVAGAIKQYGLNKQERAKLTGEIEQDIMQYGEQLTMTGNEEFDKKNSSAIEKFRRGDSNMTDLRGLSGQIARMKLNVVEEQARDTANMQRQLNQAQLGKIEQDTKSSKLIDDLKRAGEKREAGERSSIRDETMRLANKLIDGEIDLESLTANQSNRINNLPSIINSNFDPALYRFDAQEEQDFQKGERDLEKLRNSLSLFEDEQTLSKAKVKDAGEKGQFIPMQDDKGNAIPNMFRSDGILYRKVGDQFERVGTASENIGEARVDSAKDLIETGTRLAETTSPSPIDLNAAGKDALSMFQDFELSVLGFFGVEGEDYDASIDAITGINPGTKGRSEAVRNLNSLNAQIKPFLVGAISPRGAVYTQQIVDEKILADPKKDNNTVLRDKVLEYPDLLSSVYENAKKTLLNPEVKAGTTEHQKAQRVVMLVPSMLKRIEVSFGKVQSTQSSLDPSILEIIKENKLSLPSSADNNVTKGNIETLSDEELRRKLFIMQGE